VTHPKCVPAETGLGNYLSSVKMHCIHFKSKFKASQLVIFNNHNSDNNTKCITLISYSFLQ